MPRKIATPPAEEPVTLDQAKKHCRQDLDVDDDLLTDTIQTAREYLEAQTGRALMIQEWDLFLDAFPCEREIELPMAPLRSVGSVKYTPEGGSQQTIWAGDYVVDTASEPGRIVLARSASWPSDTLVSANAVVIRFEAGYDDAAVVPKLARQGILLLVGEWYANREAAAAGVISKELQSSIDRIVRLLEVPRFSWA